MANARLSDIIGWPGHHVAQACVSLGWRVVPAHREEKWPGIKNWTELATTDIEQLKDWWGGTHIGRNVCVVTGQGSGIWVLDVDPRHGGDVTLARLVAEHGPLPETLIIDTPSGGQHYYWTYPDEGEIKTGTNLGTVDGEMTGLDTRGEGGQVMAPYTARVAGVYKPRNAENTFEITRAPAWLESLARKVKRSERETSGDGNWASGNLPGVEDMIEQATDVATGAQESYLFKFLCKLRQLNRSPLEMETLGWELASRFRNEPGHPKGEWTVGDVELKAAHVVETYPAGDMPAEVELNWARGTSAQKESQPVVETTELRQEQEQVMEVIRDEARNVRLTVRHPSVNALSMHVLRQFFTCDHRGMSEVFLSIWLEDVRWSVDDQRFMVFSHRDGHWVHDGKGHEAVHRLVNELAARLHRLCEDTVTEDEEIQALLNAEGNSRDARAERAEGRQRAAAIRSWAKVLSGTGNIRSVINAISPAANGCEPGDFNRQAHLLNVKNGTYDVSKGELRRHRQADLLTHRVNLNLDLALAEKPLEEVAPLFHSLVWRMCGAPGELDRDRHQARYDAVCRYLGYVLHGSNPAKKLGVFIGTNDIGKNQVLEIEGEILDDLAFMSAKPSLLTKTRNDRHDGDESPLRGKRMVVLNELSGKQVLDDNQVLRFVNPEGSTVSLRRMHMDPVTVPITWTITASTNELPRGDLSSQVQTRLAIFPLSRVPVSPSERWDIKRVILQGGTHNGATYEPEVDAILAHLVKWWREWWVASQGEGAASGGLVVLDEMREALSNYVESERKPHELFVDECLNVGDPGGYLDSKEIVERYNTYLASQHKDKKPEYAGGRRVLYAYLETLEGVSRVEKSRGKQSPLLMGYRGLSFVSDTLDLSELQSAVAGLV